VTKLGHELKEEQEMNRCLRANQVQLQAQLAEEERKARETGESEGD
jgi:BRCA1-associated protein